jgi:hypothetical protein
MKEWRASISGYFSTREEIIAYLASLDGDWKFDHLTIVHPDTPKNTEAFHRLSTCIESCGCTGYRPKKDCPDKKCFCNND